MTTLDVCVLVPCLLYLLGRPFLWVAYRLCPLKEERPIRLDEVVGVWFREAWGHLYRVRHHVLSDWEDVRRLALYDGEARLEVLAQQRQERLAKYSKAWPAYRKPRAVANVAPMRKAAGA